MFAKSKKSLSMGLIGLFLVATTACGPGNGKLQLASLTGSDGPAGSSSGNNSSGNQGTVDVFKGVDTELYVNAVGTKHKVIWIDKVNKAIVYSIPLPGNPLGVGGKFPSPDHPDIFAELIQDPNSGAWNLNVVVPLHYFVNGVDFTNPKGLPSGSALPAIPGGELPRLGLRFFKSNGQEIFVYLSATIAAVFVPTPGFDPRIQLTFPLKNKGGTKILGYLSSVPARGSYDGGVFASFMMPPELSRIIDDMF